MVSFGAQGQGLVSFNNSAGVNSKISINSVIGGGATGLLPAGVAGSFYFALFYSTTATTVNGNANAFVPTLGDNMLTSCVWNDTNWHFAGGTGGQTYNVNGIIFTSDGYAANTATAGRVAPVLGGTEAVVGLDAGASAHFVVVGWSSNMGTTYGAVENWLATPIGMGPFYLGESAVSAPLVTGDNNLNATPTILAGAIVPGFTLGVAMIPEPGTLALVGLGGLSLWLSRRRS
jgi:hypothetical protein